MSELINTEWKEKIPDATIKRLFIYYRSIQDSGITDYISSEELAGLTNTNACQVRKDFSYFGEPGTPGKGYKVSELSGWLKNILGIDQKREVALVGIGNLGRAFLIYPGLHSYGFKITQLFDSDPLKIGKSCGGKKIKDIKTIKEELEKNQVKIAIVAVPRLVAQEVVNMMVDAGVKSILNFAPICVVAPPGVRVLNSDMTTELAKLSYYLGRDEKYNNEQLLVDLEST